MQNDHGEGATLRPGGDAAEAADADAADAADAAETTDAAETAAADAEAAEDALRADRVRALGATYGLALADGLAVEDPEGLATWLAFARRRGERILPYCRRAETLFVAVSDPLALEPLDDLAHLSGLRVEARMADSGAIASAWERLGRVLVLGEPSAEAMTEPIAGAPGDAMPPVAPSGEVSDDLPPVELPEVGAAEADEAPIVRLVARLLREGIRQRASDIHLEPQEKRWRVRFRIDGRLREIESPPRALQAAVTSRIKLMARLSLAEKRRPQDGRIHVRVDQRAFDLRVSVLPSLHGETIVMRILDPAGLQRGLGELGLWEPAQECLEGLLALPDGMLLVTGPTGSGKTTTLYAALHHLNGPDRKIITVEDPVEYQIAGINQVAVRPALGMTFARGLRAILRQAPNLIMVGEIRDRETAEVALNAALTGHLVLSTLHTNDAPSAITRLANLGAAPFLVAASLRAVVAQRLVRMICPTCRVPDRADPTARTLLGGDPEAAEGIEVVRGRGCTACGGSGFRGRKGLFEILVVDPPMERLIASGASLPAVRQRAREVGFETMRSDGLRKVRAGWTTLAEVFAATTGEAAAPVPAALPRAEKRGHSESSGGEIGRF